MGFFLAFILLSLGACIGFAICALMVVAKESDTISHSHAIKLHEKDVAKKLMRGDI